MVLFFHFELKWLSYGHFYVSHHLISETKNQKSRKWPYLAHFSSKWKNKTTFFSPTFKVEENKVFLFLHLVVNEWDMTTLLISVFLFQKSNIEKHKNCHNSVILAQNEKIRPLSFLQLLKLKVIKWSFFSTLFTTSFPSSKSASSHLFLSDV